LTSEKGAVTIRNELTSDYRYPQFCALARALEVVGERWTLLVVRELLLGPKRYADLMTGLDGISPSVLAQRLERAERLGLVRRSVLPPPAASTVYELTEDGAALRPAVYELIRWGGRRLFPARKGEEFHPDWMRLALDACARRGPSPERTFVVRIRRGRREATLLVRGGPQGTTVASGEGPADATIAAPVEVVLGMMRGGLAPRLAVERGIAEVGGNVAALEDFPALFSARRDAVEERERGER
jgi:DNA-binding HxlR family transcriptional regulator